jgi:hypothetical protein
MIKAALLLESVLRGRAILKLKLRIQRYIFFERHLEIFVGSANARNAESFVLAGPAQEENTRRSRSNHSIDGGNSQKKRSHYYLDYLDVEICTAS